MKRILCAVVLSVAVATPATAADLWWAVAYADHKYREPVTYGLAWNFQTEEKTKAAAIKSCEERHPIKPSRCYAAVSAANSCVSILRGQHPSRGTLYSANQGNSRAEAIR